jgi:hypothetical protein
VLPGTIPRPVATLIALSASAVPWLRAAARLLVVLLLIVGSIEAP